MSSLRMLVFFLVLCLGPALAACGGGSSSAPSSRSGPSTVPYTGPVPPPGPDPSSTAPRTRLDEQRRQWSERGIRDYRYTLQRTIFGPPQFTEPVVVQVRGGVAVSRAYEKTGQPVDPRNASWWPPVEGLFDLLQEAFERNADRIEIRYDPDLGYPAWASIDYDLDLGDDEHSFTARDLVPLP